MRLNGYDMFGKLVDKKNLLARLGQLSLNPPAKCTCSTDEQAPTVSSLCAAQDGGQRLFTAGTAACHLRPLGELAQCKRRCSIEQHPAGQELSPSV
jgi:hypothetical protein